MFLATMSVEWVVYRVVSWITAVPEEPRINHVCLVFGRGGIRGTTCTRCGMYCVCLKFRASCTGVRTYAAVRFPHFCAVFPRHRGFLGRVAWRTRVLMEHHIYLLCAVHMHELLLYDAFFAASVELSSLV